MCQRYYLGVSHVSLSQVLHLVISFTVTFSRIHGKFLYYSIHKHHIKLDY